MPVTYAVMAVCVVAHLVSLAVPGLDYAFGLMPATVTREPWTLITSAFFHDTSGLAHIGANLLSLWVFGRMLEPTIGSWRFAGLLLISILTAGISVVLIEDPYTYTVGLSGGIFGLIGAVLVAQVALRQNAMGTVALLGLNALVSFIVPNVSWEGHLGGFIGGVAYSALMIASPLRRRQSPPAL